LIEIDSVGIDAAADVVDIDFVGREAAAEAVVEIDGAADIDSVGSVAVEVVVGPEFLVASHGFDFDAFGACSSFANHSLIQSE
jgi:hypothetical protein